MNDVEDRLRANIVDLSVENQALRRVLSEWKRRAEQAESKHAEKVGGPSIGRAAANYAARHWKDRTEAAEARCARLEAALRECLPYIEAAQQAAHLLDGFGPKSHQPQDDLLMTVRAALAPEGTPEPK